MTLTQQILQRAETNGISIAELSRVSGIHRSSLGRYASGKVSPSTDKLESLARAAGVTLQLSESPEWKAAERSVRIAQTAQRLEMQENADPKLARKLLFLHIVDTPDRG